MRTERPFVPGRFLGACAMLLALGGCKDGIGPDPNPAVSCDTPGFVTSDGEQIPVAPGGYAAVGNRIISAATCEPARFVGVSRPSLAFTPDGARLGVDTAAAADFARIRAWKANTVRIELAQYFLVSQSRFYDPTYAARVDRVVKQARAAGLHVILALQHSDRGDPAYPNHSLTNQANMHQPMADRAHSIPFWQEIAARYKDDGGILYELYSEPFPIGGPGGFSNWEIWQNGGLHPADDVYDPRGAFQAVGMQELYDVVRATGANNLVIISGTQWGYNLEQVPNRRIQGYNIAYGTHPWGDPAQTTRQPSTWEQEWMFLAKTDPVMVTEFGEFETCRVDYARAVLDQADRLGLSWIAWAWQAPGVGDSREQVRGAPVCEFPMLLLDWGGTPSRLGEVVRDRLASY